LVQIHTKTGNFAMISIVLTIAIIAVGANCNPVLAQAQPCTAVLSYPVMPTTYSYSNVPIVVPMSATCSTTFGNTLYASGNAYDATSNVGLGIVSSVLQSTDGGTNFNGQLGFNLPPTTQGHTVTISVSLYSSQYGDLIGATSETFQAVTGSQQIQQVEQVATTTVTIQPYPIISPTPIGGLVQPPSRRHQTRTHSNFLDYVAIAAILAAVLIATAGLVVYGTRKQQPPSIAWVPALPPPR
jgi:hypothetical protein